MSNIFFKKGEMYLDLVSRSKGKKSIYYCKVCGNNIELNTKEVEVSKRYKTCGCCSSHKPTIETFYCHESGFFKTITGIIISNKIAKGYLCSSYMGVKGYTHRLVAVNFIPNPNNYSDVNHIDGDKTNNRISNLEWCNRSYNVKHAYRTGLNTGSLDVPSYKRKFSYEEYCDIMNMKITLKEMGLKYSTSITTISNIRRGKIYIDFYNKYNNIHDNV